MFSVCNVRLVEGLEEDIFSLSLTSNVILRKATPRWMLRQYDFNFYYHYYERNPDKLKGAFLWRRKMRHTFECD